MMDPTQVAITPALLRQQASFWRRTPPPSIAGTNHFRVIAIILDRTADRLEALERRLGEAT